MNTKISALKKKLAQKENQLKKKQEHIMLDKEEVKEIKQVIEQIKSEIANEEMQEMSQLMAEKNLNIDDVKAAIASGIIKGKPNEAEVISADDIRSNIEEINKDTDITGKEEGNDISNS